MGVNNKLVARVNEGVKSPVVRQFLDMVAAAEGAKFGYSTGFGGKKLSNLESHPNTYATFVDTDGKKKRTTAAGRYQFLSKTWKEQAERQGLTDFGQDAQDRAAVGLLAQSGALDAIEKGDINTALQKAGRIWASLPTAPAEYKQNTKSMDFIKKFFPTAGGAMPSLLPDAVSAAIPTPPPSATIPFPVQQEPQIPVPQAAALQFDNGAVQSSPYSIEIPRVAPLTTGDILLSNPRRDAIIDADANSARTSAVNALLGEEKLPEHLISLPRGIDEAINRILKEKS